MLWRVKRRQKERGLNSLSSQGVRLLSLSWSGSVQIVTEELQIVLR